MGKILSTESVYSIQKLRKTDKGCFVRRDGDKHYTYNDTLLVHKKDTSEALFFVITARNEKIDIQADDMFIYGDTAETLYFISPLEAHYYSCTGDLFGTISSDGSKSDKPAHLLQKQFHKQK